MSLIRSIDVRCDGPDCLAWIDGDAGFAPEADEARRHARQYGWTRRRSGNRWLDLCPECSEPH